MIANLNETVILRLTMKQVCEMLACSQDTVRGYLKDDPSFPKPLKQGLTRQAAVFFDYKEIINWYESWKRKIRESDQTILVA